ncbi:MAG: SUMF1/EgtB/PvdO family nonheme iron enzyme, partial [Anaerolineales bacterium]|nr:SUMF1/EgtB/PvdO family nonheme iron enzyme [Anaerolineales bacterium]
KDGNIIQDGNWGRECWDWLQGKLNDKGNLVEDGVLYPRYWRDARFGAARRAAPVVGISWWEANAYCKWLLENWETLEEGRQGLPRPKEIRLPTEREWVLAAGGEENGRFAFGELRDSKEITRYANTAESGIGRTTPIWMYPQGASPAGVMDMSGNVWEWQANSYDKDRDWLALRGSSWDNLQVNARVSIRNNSLPNLRSAYIGFRVVAFPK